MMTTIVCGYVLARSIDLTFPHFSKIRRFILTVWLAILLSIYIVVLSILIASYL